MLPFHTSYVNVPIEVWSLPFTNTMFGTFLSQRTTVTFFHVYTILLLLSFFPLPHPNHQLRKMFTTIINVTFGTQQRLHSSTGIQVLHLIFTNFHASFFQGFSPSFLTLFNLQSAYMPFIAMFLLL